MGLNLTKYYSINFSLPKRRKKIIKFIIIHYTGMKSENNAIKKNYVITSQKLALIIL